MFKSNWYDPFITFSYGDGEVWGQISIFNPLYVVLLAFLPATLATFKWRKTMPKWMGVELWKVSLGVMVLLFVAGLLFSVLFDKSPLK